MAREEVVVVVLQFYTRPFFIAIGESLFAFFASLAQGNRFLVTYSVTR